MNTVIEERATELQQATEALAGIREVIQEKRGELDTADTERQRLESLIVQGNRQAMTDILDARATVNGLKTHLADLHKALAGAEHRRDEAEASHIEARVNGLDVEGALNEERIKKLALAAVEKSDQIWFELFKTVEANSQAFDQIKVMQNRARELRGQPLESLYSGSMEVVTDAGTIRRTGADDIHRDYVAKAITRFKAPLVAELEREVAKERQEREAVRRDTYEAAGLMI